GTRSPCARTTSVRHSGWWTLSWRRGRRLEMRSIRLLLAPLALVSLATACGHDSRHVPSTAIAVVGDRTIARSQFAALMAQARQSYAARGRRFPAAGTAAYEHLKQLALALLVEQAELEQEAPRLGVRVDPAQVDVRLRELK